MIVLCYYCYRFVANCGGILGLCMGFSIVTVFEVLHYLGTTLLELCSGRKKCFGGAASNKEEEDDEGGGRRWFRWSHRTRRRKEEAASAAATLPNGWGMQQNCRVEEEEDATISGSRGAFL